MIVGAVTLATASVFGISEMLLHCLIPSSCISELSAVVVAGVSVLQTLVIADISVLLAILEVSSVLLALWMFNVVDTLVAVLLLFVVANKEFINHYICLVNLMYVNLYILCLKYSLIFSQMKVVYNNFNAKLRK